MKKPLALLALGSALLLTACGDDTTGLANAHRAAGYQPKCETVKHGADLWALCSIGRTAPSVWLLRDQAWATGNGVAQNVVRRLESNGPGPYQNLPRLYVDRSQPVYMPDEIRARLK